MVATTDRQKLIEGRLAETDVGPLLAERLRLWSQAGVSYKAMARLIELQTGISVTDVTVTRWVRWLQRDEEDAAEFLREVREA